MFVYWVKHPLSCLIYYIQYMPRLQVMAHWRVLLWVQATSSLSNSSAARIKLRISRVPLLNLFNRLLSASLFLLGLPPSFRASRGFVARRWRLLALPFLNMKKKKDSSQSRVNTTKWSKQGNEPTTKNENPMRFSNTVNCRYKFPLGFDRSCSKK